MLFCQLSKAKSLREICGGLSCCVGKLRHLGVKKAPYKSTLSYANAHRPWQMFQELFYQTLDVCKLAGPGKHRFRFKNKLLSLDSSTILLCLSLFPWAKFRRTKGAVKLRLLLDHDGYLPTYAYICRRTIEAVRKSIDNSLCFGVYDKKDHFVGFARVVTDYTVFAYLLDLFILESHRKRGLGKSLVKHIVNDEAFKDIRWRLDTKDAHELYRKFGFREPAFPERIMEKRNVANQLMQ